MVLICLRGLFGLNKTVKPILLIFYFFSFLDFVCFASCFFVTGNSLFFSRQSGSMVRYCQGVTLRSIEKEKAQNRHEVI